VVNGTVCSDQSGIKDHSVQLYDSLFPKRFSWHPKCDGLLLDSNGGRWPIGWRDPLGMMRSLRW
jgi:hypothetical protein